MIRRGIRGICVEQDADSRQSRPPIASGAAHEEASECLRRSGVQLALQYITEPNKRIPGKAWSAWGYCGKKEVIQRYKVLIPGKQFVVTTRHVNQIETLTADANKRLIQALESEADDDHEQLADEREERRRIK